MNLVELPTDTQTAVLVEGVSDRNAVVALARRLGRDLAREGVCVLAMGGATNIRRFVQRFGPEGLDLELAGLCDRGEIGYFERALDEAGLWTAGPGLEACGFYICDPDLEDELIRAIGMDALLHFIEEMGELSSFRIMQRQPTQRERTLGQQLHRFIGVRSGRKERYAGAMIDRLDPDQFPRPLEQLVLRV